MEDLVPALKGAHSSVGRATNHGMEKKRAVAVELEEQARKAQEARKEAAESIAAERAQRKAADSGKPLPLARSATSPTSASSPQAGLEEAMPMPKKKAQAPKVGAAAQDKHSTPMGRVVRERLNDTVAMPGQGTDAQSPTALSIMPASEPDEPSSPSGMENKPSYAFTCQGPNEQVYSEAARLQLGRWFLQSGSLHRGPEVGHYKVQDRVIQRRRDAGIYGFGNREPHPSRASPDNRDMSRELGPMDLTTLDAMTAKSGSMFVHPSMFSTVTLSTHPGSLSDSSMSSWKGQSLMGTSCERPDLNNIIGQRNGLSGQIKMTVTSMDLAHQHPDDQYENTSAIQRPPVWDLSTQMGRQKFDLGSGSCKYFEVGKYEPNPDVVKEKPKKFIGFKQQMTRSAPLIGKAQPPAMMDEKGTRDHPDRSQYRHCRVHANRITHVMKFEKDLDRPPLITTAKPLHDDSDPEVRRVVHERAMSFDADKVDRMVARRRDVCINMGRSLPRDKAGWGARIAQEDVAIRTKQGYTGTETSGQFESSIEKLKDSNRIRGDLGVTFDQQSFRGPTRLKGAYSSLHRPRDHAAPDFSRTSPAGFASRTPVKVLPRTRSHDAMPGWSAEAVDGLMTM